MAQRDWKRYYAPIMVHKEKGTCRLWAGKLFRKKTKAYFVAEDINASEHTKWRVIGIAALRGNKRNPQLQNWLLDNSK